MKKVFFLAPIFIILSSITYAEGIRSVLQQIGPGPFLTTGIGGLVFILGLLLSYVSISYGIFLLSKKYERTLHPVWSWIPIVQIYPVVQVAGQPLWWIAIILLGWFIPLIGAFVTLVSLIFIYHKLSLRLGRGAGTTLLLVFFSVVTFLWLGLWSHKKSTKAAWWLGVSALIVTFLGTTFIGAGALSGAMRVKGAHRFMDKTRDEIMKELQQDPEIREQIKAVQAQEDITGEADISKTDTTVTGQ